MYREYNPSIYDTSMPGFLQGAGGAGVPSGPGWVYEEVARELAGVAWRAAARARARIEVVRVPSLKEVHIVVGRTVLSVKVGERRWWIGPSLLRAYAASLLRHGKEYGRPVHPVLLLPRLTGGALRLAASRLRWLRLIPYRGMEPRTLLYWLLTLVLELLQAVIAWRRERGLPTRWLEALAHETERTRRTSA